MVKQHLIYLALGSNLGKRRKNLKTALQALPPQAQVSAISQVYETAPAYVLDQPTFLNMAAAGQTSLSPEELLAHLQQIERQMGRQRIQRHGPRLIDLDILFYDDLVLDTPTLTIPHPRLHERGFVLRPLADLAPELVHPVLNQSVQALLDALPGDDGVLRVVEG
jgi:2-amino-4-hydroxy-6-hydroxymethyldihydropteridine diphosphokinase